MKRQLLFSLFLIITRLSFGQCPQMDQPQNKQVCNGTTTAPVNFTSSTANVVYSWTNSNPAIGLAANGRGNIPAFNAVNTGTGLLTANITVTPKLETVQTFSYTGAVQTFVVPAGVTNIKIDARGAQGASAIYNQPGTKPDDLGGKGGRVTADYPVTPGQTIYVMVGGSNGYNGGGSGGGSIAQPNGGGASDIRIGGTALTNRIIVAGGGGGAGNNCSNTAEPGGAGGELTGGTGNQCGSLTGISVGQGGTQTQGGEPGTGQSTQVGNVAATAGQLGLGGNAGILFGTAAGGGGGGYYGGGGAAYGSGGGGSSYTNPQAISVQHTQGFQDGDGQIIITYDMSCASPATQAFTYTVSPTPVVAQPKDQSVFTGTNTAAVNFSSPTTGGYVSYDWINNTPAIGLAANGTGNIPAFTTVNATNEPITATLTVTPKLTEGILDIDQSIASNCTANISQSNLAQSFKPVTNSLMGASIFLNATGGNGSITISLWDKLPNAGGVQLATGTAASSPSSWVNVFWSPVSVTPGNTYYLVFTGTNNLNCIAGSTSNPYPDGQVYANAGYQSFPSYDYAFRTYSPGATSCAGTSQQFQITVKVLKPDANGILYVKKGSNGLGGSWANAVSELADALVMAKTLNAVTPGKVKQIWVAGGKYLPLYSPEDGANFGTDKTRDNTFLLVKDVQLYGGFAGIETTLQQRDLSIAANQSILSGDFNNDDVVTGAGATLSFSGNGENTYHVLLSAGDVGTAELNGFVVRGGSGSSGILTVNTLNIFKTQGGGMNITASSPTITNCVFENNHVQTGLGGAIYINTPNGAIIAAPTISKSKFLNNKSANIAGQGWGDEGAGAMYNVNSNPIITDCSFVGNLVTGGRFGGAIVNVSSEVQFTDVTISNNASKGLFGGGGGLAIFGNKTATLNNVIFTGNSTDVNGGAIFNGSGAVAVLNNVLFSGNLANYGAAIYNNNSSPVLTNVTISGNQANVNGAIYNTNTSLPQLQNTVVFGNNSGVVNSSGADVPVYRNSLVQGANGAGLITFNGTAADLFVAPLSPALSIGGDYRPKIGSDLANAGDQTLFVGLNANTKDLDGNARLMGSNIDLGAYELQTQPQTITAANVSKTYGDADFEPGATASSGLTVSYVSADNSIAEAFQDAADANKWKLNIKKAGTVNITASQPGNGAFSPAPDVIFSLTISQKPVTVSFKPSAVFTKVYDAGTAGTVQAIDLMLANGDVVNSDDVQLSLSSATVQYNTKDVGTAKTITLPIGNVILTGAQAGNYKVSNISDLSNVTAAITPKALTVTANNFSKVYDGAAYYGGNGISFSAFALGEDQTVLVGKLAYTGTGQGAVNTGNYTIVPGGLTSANYALNFVSGQLTISLNSVNTLTFNAQTAGSILNKTYGDADLNASANASSGLPAGYQSSNTAVATVSATGQVSILGTGTAIITANQEGDNNYGVATPVSFTLQVAKKRLSVTANDFSKTYDGIAYVGGNGVSFNGFVNDDSPAALGGNLAYGGTAQAAVNTGTYSITPGGLSSGNYDFDYKNGTLSIVQSGANVITFNSQVPGANLQLTYGSADVNASAISSSGLIVSYVSSNPAVAAVNASGEVQILSAGAATITASQPGDVNHAAASPVSFNINVVQKALTITANNFNKMYDAQSYSTGNGVSYNGFVNGENEQNLQGALSYTGTAIGAKNVGSYFITPGGYTSANYAITYLDGSLTITKANLTVMADAKTKVFGTADPALTYKVTGMVNNDAATVVTGTLKRAAGENVGTYAISNNDLTASNYTITYTGANLTITKATVTGITLSDASFTYDGSSKSILVTGTLPSGTTVSYTGNNQTAAGSYPVTANIDGGINYNNLSLQATLKINKAKQVISFKEIPAVYRDAGQLTLDITSNSPLPIRIYSDNTLVAEVTGNQEVTVRGVGLALIRAEQAGDANYIAADAVTRELRVRNEDGAKLPVRVHPAVSPNGDGINDYLRIEGIDEYPENKIGIFDANGNLVQELKGYDNHSNRFDGYKESRAVPAGTYFYMLEVKINGKWVYDKGFFVVRY
ncbi:MBG domain-containing protein [Sphingobacterium spiritivorum]|uniref:MBG domain-containing protein n=1 Tax=Sphingobacterium spiritivorum TaxID=258 RepID=UPI001919F102|nr:MBG domain-containing protein [Sphingobacterium spiritivorum]QQT25174.1 gliding motility-associated C-terminal domain-containing protein [Sphingobacterium spiritivorum]